MQILNTTTLLLLLALSLTMASCSNPHDILAGCDSCKTVMTMVKEAEAGICVQHSSVLRSIRGYMLDVDLTNQEMFKTKPPSEGDWEALRTFVQADQDIGSYHILMAIRRKKPEMYASFSPDIRCRVLVRALEFHLSRRLEGFTWMAGLKIERWKSSGKDWSKDYVPEHTGALLREGRLAVRYLAPLLKDSSFVPLRWRGKTNHWSLYTREGGLRVCDYAYHFITAILDGGRELDPKLADRDKGIAKLISRIESNG